MLLKTDLVANEVFTAKPEQLLKLFAEEESETAELREGIQLLCIPIPWSCSHLRSNHQFSHASTTLQQLSLQPARILRASLHPLCNNPVRVCIPEIWRGLNSQHLLSTSLCGHLQKVPLNLLPSEQKMAPSRRKKSTHLCHRGGGEQESPSYKRTQKRVLSVGHFHRDAPSSKSARGKA